MYYTHGSVQAIPTLYHRVYCRALCMILLCKHEWDWHLQHHFLAVQHQLWCYCRVYGEDSQVYNNGRYTHVHRWKFDRTSHLCYRFVYPQSMTVGNQDYRYGWLCFQCSYLLVSSSHHHYQDLERDTLLNVCIHVHVYNYMFVYVHVHVYTYLCVCTRMCAYNSVL